MISCEKIKALEAFAREGTLEKASRSIGLTTSGLNYLIASLEKSAGVPLLDRSKYRNRLNDQGQRVLQAGQSLLRADHELRQLFQELSHIPGAKSA